MYYIKSRQPTSKKESRRGEQKGKAEEESRKGKYRDTVSNQRAQAKRIVNLDLLPQLPAKCIIDTTTEFGLLDAA